MRRSLGCCDVIIATPDANIGMGGPAMIEGGGLGVFAPEEIGPRRVQVLNGVVDVEADDEADAVPPGQAVPLLLPGSASMIGPAPTRSSSVAACPRTGAAPTTCMPCSTCWPT